MHAHEEEVVLDSEAESIAEDVKDDEVVDEDNVKEAPTTTPLQHMQVAAIDDLDRFALRTQNVEAHPPSGVARDKKGSEARKVPRRVVDDLHVYADHYKEAMSKGKDKPSEEAVSGIKIVGTSSLKRWTQMAKNAFTSSSNVRVKHKRKFVGGDSSVGSKKKTDYNGNSKAIPTPQVAVSSDKSGERMHRKDSIRCGGKEDASKGDAPAPSDDYLDDEQIRVDIEQFLNDMKDRYTGDGRKDLLEDSQYLLHKANKILCITPRLVKNFHDSDEEEILVNRKIEKIVPHATQLVKEMCKLIPDPPAIKPSKVKYTEDEIDGLSAIVFGPHSNLVPIEIEGDGSCGVHSIMRAANLDKRIYPPEFLRLKACNDMLNRKDLDDGDYYEPAVIWLLSKDGFLDKRSLKACGRVMNRNLTFIQTSTLHGKDMDNPHVEMQRIMSGDNDESPMHDLYIIATSPMTDNTLLSRVAGLEDVPMERLNHFVPVVLENHVKRTDRASVWEARQLGWYNHTREAQGALQFSARKQDYIPTPAWANYVKKMKAKELREEKATSWPVLATPGASSKVSLETLRNRLSNFKDPTLAQDARQWEIFQEYFNYMEITEGVVQDEETKCQELRTLFKEYLDGLESKVVDRKRSANYEGYKMNDQLTAMLEFQHLDGEVQDFSYEEVAGLGELYHPNSFFATACKEIGIPVTKQNVVVLRMVAFNQLLSKEGKKLATKEGRDPIACAKQLLDLGCPPSSLGQKALAEGAKLSLRTMTLLSDKGVTDPVTLYQLPKHNFAHDVSGAKRTLHVVKTPSGDYKPLSTQHM